MEKVGPWVAFGVLQIPVESAVLNNEEAEDWAFSLVLVRCWLSRHEGCVAEAVNPFGAAAGPGGPGGFGSQPPGGFGSQPPGGFGSQPPGGFHSQPPGSFQSQPPGGFGGKQAVSFRGLEPSAFVRIMCWCERGGVSCLVCMPGAPKGGFGKGPAGPFGGGGGGRRVM